MCQKTVGWQPFTKSLFFCRYRGDITKFFTVACEFRRLHGREAGVLLRPQES